MLDSAKVALCLRSCGSCAIRSIKRFWWPPGLITFSTHKCGDEDEHLKIWGRTSLLGNGGLQPLYQKKTEQPGTALDLPVCLQFSLLRWGASGRSSKYNCCYLPFKWPTDMVQASDQDASRRSWHVHLGKGPGVGPVHTSGVTCPGCGCHCLQPCSTFCSGLGLGVSRVLADTQLEGAL